MFINFTFITEYEKICIYEDREQLHLYVVHKASKFRNSIILVGFNKAAIRLLLHSLEQFFLI